MNQILMKRVKKLMVTALSLVMLVAMPVAANASTAGTDVFNGYPVTIHDYTTPATAMWGRPNDPNYMCFRAADGKELGVMLYSDYQAMSNKYATIVQLEGGATQAVPPSGGSWEAWFTDEFNKLRGLDTGSREAAINSHRAALTEEFRQEIIRLTNEERAKVGLPALEINEEAMELAQIRAEEIVTFWSHDRPNGEPREVDGRRTNENIGGSSTPEGIVNAWMNSEGHRGNILNPEAYAIGVGAFQASTDGGWYCTQEFIW